MNLEVDRTQYSKFLFKRTFCWYKSKIVSHYHYHYHDNHSSIKFRELIDGLPLFFRITSLFLSLITNPCKLWTLLNIFLKVVTRHHDRWLPLFYRQLNNANKSLLVISNFYCYYPTFVATRYNSIRSDTVESEKRGDKHSWPQVPQCWLLVFYQVISLNHNLFVKLWSCYYYSWIRER